MPINYIANMVKSQLNMSGIDSEKGTGLGEAEFIEDAKARILVGLALVKPSSDPNSGVGQPSEADETAADEIARLTQGALDRSACSEIIVCQTDKGFLVFNVISQTRPEERLGIPNDSLRLSSTRQVELRKLGIIFKSMAETAVRAESFPETLIDYGATIIERFARVQKLM